MNMNLNDLANRLAAVQGPRGARFFGAARKGENYELRTDLNSQYADKRKEAIQRVIANLTDVSGLFPDVLKNMQTEDLEQKKLVYLYLMSYAKTQPDLVILAVNTFVKDTEDLNPLIRALAIRTMGCLRADKIIDYLCDPLRKCLADDSPYVRKTAAICVAKLFDLKPSLAIENGFIGQLQDMVADSNPSVVANAITALSEIADSAEDQGIFVIDKPTLNKLLVALGECTEWGRIAILSAVAKYRTSDEKEAEHICERVIPQFQHANGAVVIMIHIRHVTRDDFLRMITRKMAPPLVTLVSSAPEVQWVALRNINLILQKRPDTLTTEMRVFFCKYNDPPYVKNEKLAIMIRLASATNIDTLLSELKEYASEVDVDFVRRAVKAIGQCAIKIEDAAERCVHVLLELISTRVSYVVQEGIVVIKDIFRKYPYRYEGIIPTLCASLEDLDEPEAKASLIWILGEYAEKIANADELLSTFLDTFTEDPFPVQQQTLSAIVKLYIKRPESAQNLVQKVLQLATKNCDSPDIRDRAYIYWRLLSSDADAARSIILAPRPPISIPQSSLSPAILDELINEIGSLASVYHKPAESFIGRGRIGANDVQKKASELQEDQLGQNAIQTVVAGQNAENLLDFDDDEQLENTGLSATAPSFMPVPSPAGVVPKNPLDDLMGLFDQVGLNTLPPAVPVGEPAIQANAFDDMPNGNAHAMRPQDDPFDLI
ncbi:uncharacterized protein L969DRAFT_14673 [Mixia osmundae IAM 14324]|uniref:uncharacterized protein n=1 Tax=Mixia osmundae (strain CBS 9802 / IAM 14324 / JCM 22182 / KY 12970) TaxID=764103 RepID=UPI0004A55661|nr:uncharacterized protein L969DRAFT_14673 [Mixia osmundae IAM 14324]KEI42475.1 hypothetical protein L969DRAFT_14673 [Mixia osmundae IAM 14324]